MDENDELAITACELLDTAAYDKDQKSQESNFLSLLRQLPDREV